MFRKQTVLSLKKRDSIQDVRPLYFFIFSSFVRHWPIVTIPFSSLRSFPWPSGKSIFFFVLCLFVCFCAPSPPPPSSCINKCFNKKSLVIVPNYESGSWFRNPGTSSRPPWILRNILSQWRVVRCLRKNAVSMMIEFLRESTMESRNSRGSNVFDEDLCFRK